MCGIIGIINACKEGKSSYSAVNVKYMKEGKDFIYDGLIASGVRGLDSTGIFQIDKKLDPYIHKLPVSGHMFTEDKATGPFLVDTPLSPITVCHVRAATTGRVSINNAHPFQLFADNGNKNIVGVHNGTLSGWQSRAGSKSSLYSVDSEWALARIAEDGVDAFEDFDGSYSFVWWDAENPGALYFARNSQRPMYFARTPDKQHIMFGSEPAMLYWLASRNNIALEENIYETTSGKLLVINSVADELSWQDLGHLPEKKVTALVTTRSSAVSKSSSMYEDDEYEKFWKGSSVVSRKEALLSELRSILTSPNTDSSESLLDKAVNEELGKVINGAAEEDTDDVVDQFLFTAKPDWYSKAMATMAEQTYAGELGWGGDIVEFEALKFDKQTAEILGDVSDSTAGDGEVKYSAVLRGETKTSFSKYYKGRVTYAVIIGARRDMAGFDEIILAPFNAKGAKEYTEMLEA